MRVRLEVLLFAYSFFPSRFHSPFFLLSSLFLRSSIFFCCGCSFSAICWSSLACSDAMAGCRACPSDNECYSCRTGYYKNDKATCTGICSFLLTLSLSFAMVANLTLHSFSLCDSSILSVLVSVCLCAFQRVLLAAPSVSPIQRASALNVKRVITILTLSRGSALALLEIL